MVRFKGCARCGGDLYMERDAYGSYVACLQCGKIMADLDEKLAPKSIDAALALVAAVRRSA